MLLGMVDRRNRVRGIEAAIGLAALLLVGCGQSRSRPGEPDPDTMELGEPDPGTMEPGEPLAEPRLVPWELQAEGTSSLVIGVFDRLRGAHCRFLPDEQGQLRCLPLAPPSLGVIGGFVDAGCTQPVYRAENLDDVAGVVGRPVALPLPLSDCEQRYVVGELRELTAADARFSGTPGSCRESTPPSLGAGQHDFAVAEVTSPSAWVSAREVDGALVGEQLRLRQYSAEGEPAFVARLVDERRSVSCTLRHLQGELLCLAPALPAFSSYYADDECQGDLLWRADACSRDVFIGSPGELYAVGELWTGDVFSMGKACENVPQSGQASSDSFFQRGEALGLDALPVVSWMSEGDGRLQLRGLRADDGSFLALPDELFDSTSLRTHPFEEHGARYHDSERDEGCAPVWTRDAGVRCVPESTVVDPYSYTIYADPNCTEQAYFCTDSACPRELVLMAYDENAEYRAVSRNRVVKLGDAPIYSSAGANCTEMPFSGPTYFKAGETLPWDDFPELVERNGRASGAP